MDCETPLSMGFSRQEYWRGLPFPPPGVLSNPGTTSATFLFETIRRSFSLPPLTFFFFLRKLCHIVAIILVVWVVVSGIHVYLYFYDLSLYLFRAQFSSVAQSCLTLCDPMNHSMPGLPVHHQLWKFTQTHIHRVGDAIQPSHPLSSPSPSAPNPSQDQGLFQRVNSSLEVAKVLEFQLQHQSLQ